MSPKSFIRGACVALLYAVFGGTALAASPYTPQLIPNDPGYVAYPVALTQIDAPAAWYVTQGSPSVTIAIVDSGVNPVGDLAGALVPGWNVIVGNDNTADDNGHGTAVASVAVGPINNGTGVAGVCGLCRIMPVKVADANDRTNGDLVAQGILWAAFHGARVINVSMQEDPDGPVAQVIIDAVNTATAAGVVVIMIAGNYGRGDENANSWASRSPAAIRVAGVTGEALDPSSNHGAWVEVAAAYTASVESANGAVRQGSGTSFSAPLVSGVAGLLLSYNPGLKPADVRDILMSSGTKVPGLDVTCGCIINAYKALIAAGYQPPPPLTLSVTKNGDGAGVVSTGDSLLNCGTTCSAQYANGSSVTLLATAEDYTSVFVGWTGVCSGTSPCTIYSLTGDTTITATFAVKTVSLVVRKSGPGKGMIFASDVSCSSRCTSSHKLGDVVKLSAKRAAGSVFVGWTGACSGTRPVCTLQLSQEVTITAVFAKVKATKAIKKK